MPGHALHIAELYTDSKYHNFPSCNSDQMCNLIKSQSSRFKNETELSSL